MSEQFQGDDNWKEWSRLVLSQIKDLNYNYKRLVDLRSSDNENFQNAMNALQNDISKLRLEFNHVSSNIDDLEEWQKNFMEIITLEQMKNLVKEHSDMNSLLNLTGPQIKSLYEWKTKMDAIATPEQIKKMMAEHEKNKNFRIILLTVWGVIQVLMGIAVWWVKVSG